MHMILVGCGRVGASVAIQLAADEHDVIVVDKDPNTFANLGATFNGMTIVGNGIDVEVLRRAGIERADGFAAVTSLDNVNLMASQIAKKIFQVPKVIARINDLRKYEAYQEFGVETLSPTELGASYLRRMLEEKGLQITRVLGKGEVVMASLIVPQVLAGRSVADFETPGKIRIAAVERPTPAQIPRPDYLLQAGDRLLVAVRRDAFGMLRNLIMEANRS